MNLLKNHSKLYAHRKKQFLVFCVLVSSVMCWVWGYQAYKLYEKERQAKLELRYLKEAWQAQTQDVEAMQKKMQRAEHHHQLLDQYAWVLTHPMAGVVIHEIQLEENTLVLKGDVFNKAHLKKSMSQINENACEEIFWAEHDRVLEFRRVTLC